MHLAYIWIVCHLSAKNYQNRWKFDEVLTKTNLLSFFWDTVYIGLRVRYKYYKKHSRSGLAWSRPRSDPGLSRPTSVFRTRIGVCEILSRSVEIWQYEGQKPVLE